MRNLSFFLGTTLALGVALAVSPARADIPAPGYCQGMMAGDACDAAVDEQGHYVGPGVCVAEMCQRATPDGPMQYACVMCRPKKADGAAGAGAGGEGGADPVGGAGGAPVKPPMPVAGSETGGTTNGGGSAGAPISTAGAPVTNAGAANKGDASSNDAGGCSVAPGARGTAVILAGFGLALGLVLRRRRSSNLARG